MAFHPPTAIAVLTFSCLIALDNPAEARRYRSYFSSANHAQHRFERGSGRRQYRRAYRVASRGYTPVSFRSNGDDRFPIASEAPRSTLARRSSNQIAAAIPVVRHPGGEVSHNTLTEGQVYNFRKLFAQGQSSKAMHSALGAPTESYGNRDVWKIQRIGIDGKLSGKYGKLTATYRADGKSYDWNADW